MATGATSTTTSTPSGAIARMAAADVVGAVVHDVVGAGGPGQGRLLGGADGGDDGGARPPGQLDGGVADRARPARHQDGAAGEGARAQAGGALVGHRQGPVGGEGGDAQAGADVERRARGQGDGVVLGDGDQLLGGAVRPVPGRLPQPHPLADPARRRRPAPTATMVPAPSWLGTVSGDRVGSPGRLPLRTFQSVGLTPDTATRTTTSPGPGSGSARSTSRSTSGPPVSLYTTALIGPTSTGDGSGRPATGCHRSRPLAPNYRPPP